VIEVVKTLSTPPSTTIATPAKLVKGRRHQNKQRESRKPLTKRSSDWKLVDSVFEPLYARFDFTLEDCDDDEGLNSHNSHNSSYLIVRRVIRSWRDTYLESVCS
jgi:hypothetical protein